MNFCNGVSINNVPLLTYQYRDNIYYENLVMLDIEVSSGFVKDDVVIGWDKTKSSDYWKDFEKISLLYLWNICIDGYLYTGRDLETLKSFLIEWSKTLNGTMYIYIHNAGYEFQFLRNIFEPEVFARKKRHPLKFTWLNFEFRCSYMLTRLSLANWANEKKLSIKKLEGVYDYHILRTPYTKLSILERDYGYYDVLVGVEGLKEYRERYKHVKNIPITQTGIVRKELNKRLNDDWKFRRRSADMTDIRYEDYVMMVKSFIGGYTHANMLYADRVIYNLFDHDISSSYPWAMLSESYPSTRFVHTRYYDKYMNTKKYSFVCEVEFYNLKSRYYNHYLSVSKCLETRGAVIDNGRLMQADYIRAILCDVDFEIMLSSYQRVVNDSPPEYNILDFMFSIKKPLSNVIILYILELFNNKTSMKGIDELYDLYFKSKEEINSLYGMGVTKDITDDVIFNNDWDLDKLTVAKYNEKRDEKVKKLYRMNLAYAQGIYVPAYGRRNLWSMVSQFDDIAVYMDTDSIKTLQDDSVLITISEYNKKVRDKQQEIADRLSIPVELFRPKDIRGVEHSIGEFERDKDIDAFKTLGAKRYVCQYGDSLKMTVSGVRKSAVSQLNTIDDFKPKMIFDIDNAGKLLLCYLDNQPIGITWKKGEYDEYVSKDRYGICSYNIEYKMSDMSDYLDLIGEYYDETTEIIRKYEK